MRSDRRRLVSLSTVFSAVFALFFSLGVSVTARAQQNPQARAAYDEAQALTAQKRPAEAVAKLRVVTTMEPGFVPAWFALASAARRAGDCAEAVPAYRYYAQLRPTEAEPLYGLGLCLRDTGDRAGAIATLKRYIDLQRRPGVDANAAARWIENARGVIAALEGAPARTPTPTPAVARPTPPAPRPATVSPPSAPAPAAARPAAPSPGASAYAEAQRLRDSGRIEQALQKFREVVALDPDLMAARAAWGELLIKIGRDEEAIGVFRAALQRNQQYPLIWYELAFTLRDTRRLAEAVDAYQRYIQLRPDDPDPYYGLGRSLQRLGRAAEARRAYETYLTLEKRPSERRFVASAEAEVAALSGRAGNLTPAGGATPAPVPPLAPARDRSAGEPR